MRGGSRRTRLTAVAALSLALLAAVPALGATPSPRLGTGSAAAVRFDPGLRTLRGSKPVAVLVRLAYAPTGTARTGAPVLRARAVEARFVAGLRASVPSAVVGQRLRAVFGGVALRLPGVHVRRLAKLPGVVAVRRDVARVHNRRASVMAAPLAAGVAQASAIAASGATQAALAAPLASDVLAAAGPGSPGLGRGVIVGVLDGGIWPEHPAFASDDSLPQPPARADFGPRTCDFGAPAAGAPTFTCNRKVIGGEAFLATYTAIHGKPPATGARDADGRGTAMASAAAGRSVARAHLGDGIYAAAAGAAPEAHLAAYRVCGPQGCYDSDVIAGLAEAVADGVDVVAYAAPGGLEPAGAVAQSFLDAYAAGVLVVTAAGDGGPAPGSVQHRAPWTLTVGASSARTELRSTLTLTAGAQRLTLEGFSITGPITAARLVDRGTCAAPGAAGSLGGRVALCATTPAQARRAAANAAAGGAVGVVLRSTVEGPVTPVRTQIPSLLLDSAPGAAAAAFLAANPSTTASSARVRVVGASGSRVAPFSGRGPGGAYVKPDIVAEGVAVIAAALPSAGGIPWAPATGTAFAAARATGAAAAVLSTRTAATPSDLRSALTLSARPVTDWGGAAAGPDVAGAGGADVEAAIQTPLKLEATAAEMRAAGTAAAAAALNLPTIAVAIPGRVTVRRTFVNRSAASVHFAVSGIGPVRVAPAQLVLAPGATGAIDVTIDAPQTGRAAGEVVLTEIGGARRLHLPVVVERTTAPVSFEQSCLPTQVAVGGDVTCSVHLRNDGVTPLSVAFTSRADGLQIISASGAELRFDGSVFLARTLQPGLPIRPSIAPAATTPSGFLPLATLGAQPVAIGDEQAIDVTVPAFVYGGATFTRLGVVSNGYLVPGGTSGPGDVTPVPALGSPTAPNGVLAPYWADLTGVGAQGVRLQVVTVGDVSWIVVEWSVVAKATGEPRAFQVWLRTGETEDVLFTYPNGSQPGAGGPLQVGAESLDGSTAAQTPAPPAADQRVATLPATPGEEVTYSFVARGVRPGAGLIETLLDVSGWFGGALARTPITITP